MSNVNNRGNGNGGRNRKRNRGGNQPGPQPPQKKQRRARQGKKRARGGANSAGGGNAAFSAPQLHFAPVAVGAKMSKTKPMFERSADQQRIVHREKIAKLTSGGTGVFAVLRTVALNPGVAASFPWLSNEAAGYESYRFNRLRFVWVPSIGSAVAGNVIMGPDYDANDPAPVGETALSSYTDADEERVWAPLSVECNPEHLNGNQKRKYMRLGALSTAQDIKLYDSGNFFVAVTDDAAAQTGKLWVEYDVTLYDPQVPSGGFQMTGTLQAGTGLTAAIPFGTAAVGAVGAQVATGALALSANVANDTVTITGVPVGSEISIAIAGGGTVITAVAIASLVGLTVKAGTFAGFPAAATSFSCFSTFNVTAENPTFDLAMTATTITSTQCVISVLAPQPAF